MASSKAYFDFILEQLSELEEITYRTMMGEYIIYYCGRIVGGIYDDRLLVKPVKSAISLIPDTNYEMTTNILMEILESQNDLEIIIALVEWEALIEQEEIDAYWTNANSWILLYQIVLKNPDNTLLNGEAEINESEN